VVSLYVQACGRLCYAANMQHSQSSMFNASLPCSGTAWHLQGSCQAVRQAVRARCKSTAQPGAHTAPTCAHLFPHARKHCNNARPNGGIQYRVESMRQHSQSTWSCM
jgi:hypothetical protein